MFKRIIFLAIYFSGLSFAQENPIYYNMRDVFNKGYYSQIFSSEFGVATSDPSASKLIMVKTGVLPVIKNPEKEPLINELDYLGMAPIHYFSTTKILSDEDYRNMKEIGELLISLGANINLKNQFGIKPIRLAMAHGNYAAVEAFLGTHKLVKDITLLRSLFSEDFDDEWQYDRDKIIEGKVEIWKKLRDAWLPSEAHSLTHLVNLKVSSLENYLRYNPMSKYLESYKNRMINECLKLTNSTLNITIDFVENGKFGISEIRSAIQKINQISNPPSTERRKLVQIPGTRFSVEVKEGKTIPAQKLEKRG